MPKPPTALNDGEGGAGAKPPKPPLDDDDEGDAGAAKNMKINSRKQDAKFERSVCRQVRGDAGLL